jgi:hypothetical protein
MKTLNVIPVLLLLWSCDAGDTWTLQKSVATRNKVTTLLQAQSRDLSVANAPLYSHW